MRVKKSVPGESTPHQLSEPQETPRIIFATVHDIVFNAGDDPQSGIIVVLESQDQEIETLLCVRTNEAGKLPISHDLPEGSYMMTMLYSDNVQRQPIFIGKPKGSKPKGSARKLA